MVLLLAPYNDAMRLGMGFNSFTQELCINDAVKRATGSVPSEKFRHPEYKFGLMASDISQDVTWTAKFVNRVSEVADSMNVSGSLQVKCDTIGGRGSASASFIDTNKFKESDINYLIQVKVTNQRLVAPDLTEFVPIANLPDSEFTRIYGDSFISGFTVGGEFSALVSIKLKDRSKAREIRGQLKLALEFPPISVSGKGQVEATNTASTIDGETTINVSWRGGGDIKDESIVRWTLENLRTVAMEFPEHVMAYPTRSNAIITRYINLKSFYKMSTKSTPLVYENAGVYSSALLDVYIDYKTMWCNIQTATWEVEHGQSELIAKAETTEVKELREEAQENYKRKLKLYDESPNHKQGDEPPMPPNDLVPYDATRSGLDKAQKDCRLEMIKVVQEVDTVAKNPKVACDPTRIWQYLSPAVFRMLLPTVKTLEKGRVGT